MIRKSNKKTFFIVVYIYNTQQIVKVYFISVLFLTSFNPKTTTNFLKIFFLMQTKGIAIKI